VRVCFPSDDVDIAGDTAGWQSTANSAVVRKYDRLASAYDAKWPFYIETTARQTIARLRIGNRDRVLDVGCGTGSLLQQLAAACPHAELYGIDPAPGMLAAARGKLSPTIMLREGWAEEIPFENEEFDAVVSCNVLHHLHEPTAALREMTRVLRTGGQLVITDWCHDYLTCRFYGWWLRFFKIEHTKIFGSQEFSSLLSNTGLADVQVDRYKINWFWGLMTAKATRSPHGEVQRKVAA
jgi:ubiquinone/menaquinone biosynthesis C-methylase UbiE